MSEPMLMTTEVLDDLVARMGRAEAALQRMAFESRGAVDQARLEAKAEGVALARGYTEEILRAGAK